MEPRDGDPRKRRKGTAAPPARKRRKAPPSLASPPSVRIAFHMARGGGPARGRRKPTGAAAPPSLAPPPSVRMAHGDGGGVAPPARKRRKGSSLPTGGKRASRADSEGSSGRNGSDGGRGGTEESSGERDDGSSGRNGSDAGCAGLAGGEDIRQGLAGRGDDPNPNPNGSGAGGAGHTGLGHPDAPSAPPENVAAPAARGRRISVAHTPNIPPRFEALLRNITSLIPYESEGKSYECTLSRMNTFLRWSKSEMALFFEWSDDAMEMTCWMHDIRKGEHIKLTVNAAFSHAMDDIKVERAAVAFSTNFSGDDEYWSGLKDMLSNMFGSFEEEGLKQYDYLYVFTRVGDSICFRNFKIISLPNADDSSSGFVLTEINSTFCLKLVNGQGTLSSSHIGPRLTKNQNPTKLSLCPVTLYSIPNGQMGSCLSHRVDFSETTYSVLENGPYVSSLEELEGFNTSLAEIVVKEPLLKMKHIIGSATNKTYCFARERCKSILQSLFAQFAMLLESGKCISGPCDIHIHNVLVRANEVKLYGLNLTDYSEELAKQNVRLLVKMVRSCFREGEIPIDLFELLEDLENGPLNEIKRAKNDASLLKAEDRRSLLINLYSEYMTNVEAKSPGSDQINDESDKIDEFSFFDGCPYAEDWKLIMKDNEYMVQICNVEESSDDDEGETNAGNQNENPSVKERMRKKERMSKNTSSIRRMTKKKKHEINKGKLQFRSKRNFVMLMPEKARKDGIFPFRLGMADHILTAYFPRFLRFVQKRMREVKAQREKFKKNIS